MIRGIRRIYKSQKVITVCITILSILFLIAVCAPWIAPNNPVAVHLSYKLHPPSWEFPLGTDHLGRCNLSRLLYGARISLGFAVLIFISSLVIGLIVGTISGYKGGWIDQLLMRFCDGVMAFPNLILVLGLVGIFGPGLPQVILALMLVQWVYYARIFRGMVLSLKEENFIKAAKINGSSQWKIMKKHIIPNVLPPLVVMGTLEMGWAIMDISAMSFLGLGVQPPAAEWGAMIHEGKSYIRTNPELMIYPGMMIMLVVVTFNILGESLSDKYGVKRR
ncbi:nickel ABC transporter permease subunit NikC [Bacillus vallismortis]|uniref:nickel ABC transporter permease subunit NikC n=1 Tax=Bacillus vallismortis TaxID=72361 RepID=UPI0002885761|nr:nickel ABC transporter permease subunit NikC [Bacillus vallismortis]MBG9771490.1 nickel transporter permease NikC [Bacillus vallismortis]MCY7893596.1 nickel ABC transporter permease subunit NikC [Bacillus vallismortis]MCY7917776.1 nickel ABC transporter permease subunit NikC [Bacillus vallismortis]MCY8426484.1 nickel ABC transporter permease subunit NikC [Bacillus vallismortis]MCY8534313.1 nickel ABC transporter permease subunit NikC [Bacillus vallismortis]